MWPSSARINAKGPCCLQNRRIASERDADFFCFANNCSCKKNVATATFGKVATATAEFVGFYSILQKNAFATFRFLHLQLFFLHLQFFVADKLLRPQRCANISYLTGTRTYENSKAAFAKKQGFKSTIKKSTITSLLKIDRPKADRPADQQTERPTDELTDRPSN